MQETYPIRLCWDLNALSDMRQSCSVWMKSSVCWTGLMQASIHNVLCADRCDRAARLNRDLRPSHVCGPRMAGINLALQCFSSPKPCQLVPFAPVNCVCMQPNRTVASMHCPQHVHNKYVQHHPAMHVFVGADCVEMLTAFR